MKGITILLFMCTVLFANDMLKEADKFHKEKKFKEAKVLYEKLCENNISKGCARVAFIYENGLKTEQNQTKAFDFYKKACELGGKKACYKIGTCYDFGGIRKVEKDFNKAASYYKKACDRGFELACFALGKLYQYSLKPEENRDKMIASYEKACNNGAILGCYKLGNYYEQDDVNDYTNAKKWYQKGCNSEDTQACFRLVDIYIKELSKLDSKSFKKKVEKYKTRCENLDMESCYKYAAFYATGRGVKQSYKKARKIFEKGCGLGDNAACMEAYMLIESGF